MVPISNENRLLLYPSKARIELQGKKIFNLSLIAINISRSKKMLSIFNYSLAFENSKRALFVLSRLDTYGEMGWIDKKIEHFIESGYTCYVKLHPLTFVINNLGSDKIIYLRNDLPVEIIDHLWNLIKSTVLHLGSVHN